MNSLINWFSQVFAVIGFNLRSLPERKGAAASAAIGIGGVVLVLVGVLSIAEGFHKTMKNSGAPDRVIVLRSGAANEMTSGLGRDEIRLIADAPGLARDPKGSIASGETFVIINLPKRGTGRDANVPLRGVEASAFQVRPDLKFVQGRAFEPGKNEICVGVGAAREFAGLEVGKKVRVGRNDWEVVGIFSADGALSESEIWTDRPVLNAAYGRDDSFQSVYAKLNSAGSFQEFKDALTSNPQLKVSVQRQSDYYAEQSSMMTGLVRSLGFSVAGLMALGAIFGALNTMYSNVASRSREIATLRALGFGSGPVVLAVIAESLALALIGGTVGAAAAYFAFNGFTAATMNFQTFSQVAFAFAVTPQLIVAAIIWAVVIGVIGGFFPAIRAARLPIAAALRDV
jgi:putative ABC transport system permease protein